MGRNKFFDIFRVKESEEEYDDSDDFMDDDFEDDFDDYDDEDDFEEERKPVKPKKKESRPTIPSSMANTGSSKDRPAPKSAFTAGDIESFAASHSSRQTTNAYGSGSSDTPQPAKKKTSSSSNVVSIDRRDVESAGDVYVIRPQEFDDAQVVADLLKKGRTIVINLEGVQIESAQRIIDFIGGACYGLFGDLSAISNNIFIASPHNIEVSGDLRDEIINETSIVPNLGKY